MRVRSAMLTFDDRRELSELSSVDCSGVPSMTKQQFRDDCDINVMVARALRGEILPQRSGSFGDFTAVRDFHSAMNQVTAARDAFMSLPAKVRSRFDNDPGALLDFLGDPSNLKEAVELGLITSFKEVSDGDAAAESASPVGEAEGAPGGGVA